MSEGEKVVLHKVCKPEELESFCLHGWTIVERFDTVGIETVVIPGYYDCQTNKHISNSTEVVKGSVSRFLLKRDDTSIFSEVTMDRDAAQRRAGTAEAERDQAIRQREEAKKDLEEKDKELKRADTVLNSETVARRAAETALEECRKAGHAMERDWGKIATAIGHIRMSEILGGEKK